MLVKDVLDELPGTPTTQRSTTASASIVFNHIFASYYDDGHSVYDELTSRPSTPVPCRPRSRRSLVERVDDHRAGPRAIKTDPAFAELVAEQLKGKKASFAAPIEELIANDETFDVEFKSTARWNLASTQGQAHGGRDREDGRSIPEHRRRHAADRRR